MKLKVLSPLNEHKNNTGVSVYTLQTIELPLYIVLQEHFVDLDNKPVFKIDPSEERSSYRYTEEGVRFYQFSLKNKKNLNGFILYNNTETAAEFILQNYAPSNGYKLDILLREISYLPKKRQKQILIESLIRETNLFISDILGRRSIFYDIRQRNRQDFGPLYYEPVLIEKISSDDKIYTELNSYGKYVLYKKVRRNKLCIISIANDDGEKTNVIRKMLIHPSDSSVCFYYDGSTTQVILLEGKLDENTLISCLSKQVYDELNTYGKAIEADREYLVPQEFRPLYLLRVPSYQEASVALKDVKNFEKECSKIMKNFTQPLLVYDTRSTIKLQKKVKIINSTDTSLAILSYVTDWFYSPNNIAVVHNIYPFLEQKPYYLALGVIE